VVQIDDEVQGCPMEEDVFLKVLDKYLNEFGVKNAQ
jgi:coenzyme F420-reducing hydrogenase gamma subunit